MFLYASTIQKVRFHFPVIRERSDFIFFRTTLCLDLKYIFSDDIIVEYDCLISHFYHKM